MSKRDKNDEHQAPGNGWDDPLRQEPGTPAENSREEPTGEERERNYREYVARRREHLAAHVTPDVLAYLEEEFQTNLPCYQTRDPLTGQPLKPDPIAAAIRDGQREVVLWLRHEISMHRKRKKDSPL